MKKTVLLIIALISTSTTFAKHGKGEDNDKKNLVCTETKSGLVLAEMPMAQKIVEVQLQNFDLTVKSRGDDIGEILVVDRRSGDSLKVKTLEELLKVTLSTDEDPAQPVVLESTTHKGAAQIDISTGADSASIKSQSRRSTSQVDVSFVTDENSESPIQILCKVVRK